MIKIPGEALFLVLRPELDGRAGGRARLPRADHHVRVQVDPSTYLHLSHCVIAHQLWHCQGVYEADVPHHALHCHHHFLHYGYFEHNCVGSQV